MNHHRLLLLLMSILFLAALFASAALAVVPTRSAGIGVEDRVENGAYSLTECIALRLPDMMDNFRGRHSSLMAIRNE